jgi:magnesium transporter
MSRKVEAAQAVSPTGCVAHTRAYRDGRLAEQGFDVARISDLLGEPGTVVWLDLLQPSEADLSVLNDELGLHPLAVEDALHAHQRPKIDRYTDHLFLAAYAVVLEGDEVETAEIAAFLTPTALVTVRKDPRVDLAPVLSRWDAAPQLARSGVAYLAHGLVDVLVDGYVAVTQELDDRADVIEDALFLGPGERELQEQTFAMRSSVTRLRRVVLPMQEVVSAMRRPDVGLVDELMAPYLRDVDDHVLRVLAAIDSVREQLATILDTTIALQGQRLNQTLFRLTAWAAILAVTTAITGYFGQNVPYPGSEQVSGLIGSTVLLTGAVGGLFLFFKRKGWL